MSTKKIIVIVAIAVVGVLAANALMKEKPQDATPAAGEETSATENNAVSQTIHDAKEATEETADKAADSVEKAADAVKDDAEKSADSAEKAVDEATDNKDQGQPGTAASRAADEVKGAVTGEDKE